MPSVYLSPITGDLRLPAQFISGLDQVAQRLKVRLGTVLGTYAEDATVGLPWDRWILYPTQVTETIVSNLIRLQLEKDPAVEQVLQIRSIYLNHVVRVNAAVQVRADGVSGILDISGSPLLRVGAPALFVITGRQSPGPILG